MTQLLQGYLGRRRGPTRPGLESEDWRRVPRINLLPRTGRTPTAKLVIVGLILFLVIEGIVALSMSTGVSGTRDDTEQTRLALAGAERRLTFIETEIQDLHSQIDQLRRGSGTSEDAVSAIDAKRVDWGASIAGMFVAQIPGVRFESVVTEPSTGKIAILGTADDVAGVVGFQAQLGQASNLVLLESLRWEEGEESLSFSADLSVLKGGAGE